MKKTITFLLVVILLSGCAVKPAKEKVTLKVLYNSSDEFMNKYGIIYLASTANIDFEVIPLESYLKNGITEEQYLKLLNLKNLIYYMGLIIMKRL